MVGTVEELFEQRDVNFYNQTNEILTNINEILKGANIFIDESYGHDLNRIVEWEGATLVSDLVALVGVVSYEAGTVLLSDDDSESVITVTDDNKEYFKQIIRINIPVTVVETNSCEVVIKYLREMQVQNGDIQNEDLVEDDGFDIAAPPVVDFDLSGLTEAQLASMALNSKHRTLN